MIKNAAAILLSMALCGSLIGGCASTPPAPAQTTQQATTKAAAVTQAAATTAAESKPATTAGGNATTAADTATGYSGEITISTQGGPGADQGWQKVIDAYKQVQPNVKINLELKPSENYKDWLQKEVSSGTVRSDIVSGGPQMANGQWLDFFEYTNKVNPYTNAPWSDSIDMTQQKFISPNGALEIVATDGIKTLLVYNADKFAELGLQPPKTWDDLIAVSQKIKDANYIPIAIGGNEDSFTSGVMSWLLIIYGDQYTRDRIQYNRAQPGDYCYDSEIDGVWKYDPTDPYNDFPYKVTQNVLRVFSNYVNDPKCSQDTPATRQMMQNLGKVFPKYVPDGFYGVSDNSAYALFLQQKALMYFGATWSIPTLYNDLQNIDATVKRMQNDKVDIDPAALKSFKFSTVAYPSMTDNLAEAPVRGFEGAAPNFSVVSKDKAHNDMVMDFIMFYTTGANFSQYLSGLVAGGGTPSGIIIIKDAQMPAPYDTIMGGIKYGDGSVNDYSTILFRGANNMGAIPEFAREVYNYDKDYLDGKITIEEWGKRHQQNVINNYSKFLEVFKINPDDLKTPEKQPTAVQ